MNLTGQFGLGNIFRQTTTHRSFVQYFDGERFRHIVFPEGLFELLQVQWGAFPLPKHHQINVTMETHTETVTAWPTCDTTGKTTFKTWIQSITDTQAGLLSYLVGR